jgi:hypothetical protein
MTARTVRSVNVNRAPVLTLWATIVAERMGFDRNEALTLGRAVAGLDAYSKGKALGLFSPRPKTVEEKRKRLEPGATLHIKLLHRAVPVVRTPEGLRAVSKGRPASPTSVERYLQSKFGDALPSVERAMAKLASSLRLEELAARAFELYEAFRPEIPAGLRGWGAAGVLDLDVIVSLARAGSRRLARRSAPS